MHQADEMSNSSEEEAEARQKPLVQYSDEELVREILRRGDNVLREELYRRYAPFVYKRSLAVMRDADLAKDITHDVMIKIFLRLSSFSFRSSFAYWVHRITYNHCFNVLKKDKKWKKETLPLWEELEDKSDAAIEQKVLQEVKLLQLERAMECLKESERMLLWMYYRDELPLKDIAKMLDLGLSAVKMRLKRSRERLAEIYKNKKQCNE